MKKLFVAIVSGVLSVSTLTAQTPADGFYSMLLQRSPVALSMGGASIAYAQDDALATYGNVAVSALNDGRGGVAVSNLSWAPSNEFKKMLLFGVSGSFRAGSNMILALSADHGKGYSYQAVDEFGLRKGEFTTTYTSVSAAAGLRIGTRLGIGAQLRFHNESHAVDYKPSAVCADIYAAYRLSGIYLSAGVNSLGTVFGLDELSHISLPTSLRAGASYDINIAQFNLMLTAQYDYYLKGYSALACGACLSYRDFVHIRAGYHYADSALAVPGYISGGLGLSLKGCSVDLCYLAGAGLPGSVGLSLGYNF